VKRNGLFKWQTGKSALLYAQRSTQTTYQVQLAVFEGPLDLLLQLIERQELDITKVSLAAVTDQYLAHIRLLEDLEAAALADFLVVAARLLYIKSQVLLPRPPAPLTPEEEDPGEALARQLREYKRFKQVAKGLREREVAGLRSYPREAPPPQLASQFRLEDVTLADLLAAIQEALARLPALPDAESAVPPLSVSIDDRIADIARRTAGRRRISFRALLRTATSRVEVIVTFLALLELIRQCRVTVVQEALFEDIAIEGIADDDAASVASSDGEI
jgi:segregation and condensation protein A